MTASPQPGNQDERCQCGHMRSEHRRFPCGLGCTVLDERGDFWADTCTDFRAAAAAGETGAGEEADGRAWACDGCGDRLPSQHVCVAPTGEHTWRPLPAPSAGQDTERPAIDEDSCAWCDLPSLGYADSSAGILPSCGSDGHGFDGTWYPAPDLVRQFIAERDDLRRELDQARAQVQRVEALTQQLLNDRYDSGTDHGHGYSDGLEEAADRIRRALDGET